MACSRVAAPALVAALLCASCAPWPPPPGSCIQAIPRSGKGAQRYTLGGARATRNEVVAAISGPGDDPALPAALHRGEVGAVLVLTGLPAAPLSVILPLLLFSPLPLAFTLPAVVPVFVGIGLVVAADERLHRAVNAYNARVARDGSCPQRPAPPPSPPPWPGPSLGSPPSKAEPEDPLHPRYGPPPLPP